MLLPSITVGKKSLSGGSWKPSLIESQQGFVPWGQTEDDVMQKLQRRKEKLDKYEVAPQPTPIILGPLTKADFYVCIDETVYSCGSCLKAVDLAAELLFLLQSSLPPDSLLPWRFLHQFVYNFESLSGVEYPSLLTLKRELKF